MIKGERLTRWKILRQQLPDIFIILYLLLMVFWLFYILILATIGAKLARHYPRALGFRDFYNGLLVVSLCVLPIGAFFGVAKQLLWFEEEVLKKLVAATSFLVIGVHFYYSFSILEKMRVAATVKNFKASNDSDAALLTTYILSAYDRCCFLEESAPPLDCESRNFEYPCYEDIALFTDFQEDMVENCDYLAFVNPEKSSLDDFNEDGKLLKGYCRNDLEDFFKSIGGDTFIKLGFLSSVVFILGIFTLWVTSEWAITLIG